MVKHLGFQKQKCSNLRKKWSNATIYLFVCFFTFFRKILCLCDFLYLIVLAEIINMQLSGRREIKKVFCVIIFQQKNKMTANMNFFEGRTHAHDLTESNKIHVQNFIHI